MILKTDGIRPSVVLQHERFFGTYDRAVAWVAVHGGRRFGMKSELACFIADLYGIEIGQVVSDVDQAREREKQKPVRSISERRLFYESV